MGFSSVDLYLVDSKSTRRVDDLVRALPEIAPWVTNARLGDGTDTRVVATRLPSWLSGQPRQQSEIPVEFVAHVLGAIPVDTRGFDLGVAFHGVDWHGAGRPSTWAARSRRPGAIDPFDPDFTLGPAMGFRWMMGHLYTWAMVDRGAEDLPPALKQRIAAAALPATLTETDIAWLEPDEAARATAQREESEKVIKAFSWSKLERPAPLKGSFGKVLDRLLQDAGWTRSGDHFEKRLSLDERLTLMCSRTPHIDRLECTLVWQCPVAGHAVPLPWSPGGELSHPSGADSTRAAVGWAAAAALAEQELVPTLSRAYLFS